MDDSNGAVTIGRHQFRRYPNGCHYWLSSCYEAMICADSDQPAIDVEFHLITCGVCRRVFR